MTTSFSKTIAIVAASASLLVGNAVFAKGFNLGSIGKQLSSNGNQSNNTKHFTSSNGLNKVGVATLKQNQGNGQNNDKNHNGARIAHEILRNLRDINGGQGGCNNGNCNNGGCNNGGCDSNNTCNNDFNNGQFDPNQVGAGDVPHDFEPFHSTYIVLPGDTFAIVSLKEYSTSDNARFIAQFNGLRQTAALVPGQRLVLPFISVNGSLSAAHTPPAEGDTTAIGNTGFNPPVFQTAAANVIPATFTTTSSSVATPVAPQPPRTRVPSGSTLLVDGQTFGEKPGVARLRVSGIAMPVEVIEWSKSAVKVHLPAVDVSGSASADLEVTRADGSLASKTGIELSASPVQVALGK